MPALPIAGAVVHIDGHESVYECVCVCAVGENLSLLWMGFKTIVMSFQWIAEGQHEVIIFKTKQFSYIDTIWP